MNTADSIHISGRGLDSMDSNNVLHLPCPAVEPKEPSAALCIERLHLQEGNKSRYITAAVMTQYGSKIVMLNGTCRTAPKMPPYFRKHYIAEVGAEALKTLKT